MNTKIKEFFNIENSINNTNDDELIDNELKQVIDELKKLKDEDPVSFNASSEKVYVKILCKLIDEFKNRLYVNDAINETAFIIDISTVTSKRYLLKHTTRRAQFYVKDKIVHCRKHDHHNR